MIFKLQNLGNPSRKNKRNQFSQQFQKKKLESGYHKITFADFASNI